MKDQLEDFVHRNRQRFDDREPSPKVWKGIEASLGLKEKSPANSLFLWRAAAIFFMALSVYLMIPKGQMGAENSLALKEFSDVEAFYVQQISNKVELIQEFHANDGLNGFTHDFHQLEAMYLVLKEEMKTRPSDKVKDALVLNLLVRIDLLNKQLQQLEDKKAATQKEQRST
jgi:hypothetical protein